MYKKSFFKIWYLAAIFILLAIYLFYNQIRKESIYKNAMIVNGYVYQINNASLKGSSIVIKYKFRANGHEYYGGIDSPLSYKIREDLLNTYFPVLCDSTNPDNSLIMTESRVWKKLNKELPDTLFWLQKYW